MKIFSANIKDNPDMPDAHVRHDIRKIKSWMRGWDFGFWQEIGEAADHRAIKAIFGRVRFGHTFGRRATPITYNRLRWSVLDKEYVRTHAGMGGVSPARGFAELIVKHRFKLSVPPLAMIGSHFVSGAWYGQHSHQAWRREKWHQHWEIMQQEVLELNSRGISVFVAADWNRHKNDIPKFTPSQQWVVSNGYYDHIAFCPADNGAKVKVTVQKEYKAFLYTDHNPVAAVLSLSD